MAQQLYGSICYTDLIEMLKTGKYKGEKAKNGKKYIDINIWVNDEVDQYRNSATIQLQPKKEIWEAEKNKDPKEKTKTIIGNLKRSEKKEIAAEDFADEDDDLPFS